MKRFLIFAAFAAMVTVVAACKKGAWCPTEVSVPMVCADIPDTVDAGKEFTADFVLHKGVCIKEYGVHPQLKKDTIFFAGAAIQDYCDEFPDTASVEKSVKLILGDYDRYLVVYHMIDTTSNLVKNTYKYIVINKN